MFNQLKGLWRAWLTATMLMTAGALGGCGSSDAATSATVVLVHGAWADGSSWATIVSLLQQHGVNVVAVQLPRTSLADDASVVTQAIDAQSGPVILVGHSYGGAVITQAGIDPKVAALVYVSAFAPGNGESINDITAPFPTPAWEANGLIVNSAGFLTLTHDTFLNSFAPDVPKATAAVLAVSQGPLFSHCLEDKVSIAAWKTKPSWWVYGDQDQIIPPQFQQLEAKTINATLTVIPGASHVALISQPNAVANVILSALSKTGNL
ncbi:Pimeloyl-ACP methyl ester carboxylesterase [Pararobbsia alpina]|uniref:alpha/beta fold hydrolase n=1 Tax=Pararobbsia alpina TaxID=621374 RepID=UPI0039A6C3A6